MNIRNLKPQDLHDVISLWNESLNAGKAQSAWYAQDYRLDDKKMRRILEDPNFDCKEAFVAMTGGRIAGFGRGVVKKAASYEGEPLGTLPGYLEALAVKPSCRHRGIGSRLLEQVEATVKAAGKRTIQVSCFSSAIAGISVLPQTPEYRFLVKRHFKPDQVELRLTLSFENFALGDEVKKTRKRLNGEGIDIRYYEAHDRERFAACMLDHEDFHGWWHRTYKPNLSSARPLPVLIAVDTSNDRVVGFVGFVHVTENGQAAFSPGVDPRYRRRGIGGVLVNLWADEVQKRGARESMISTGQDNAPAQRIYFDMGYKVVGRFCARLIKRIDGAGQCGLSGRS